ncbi:MAG: uncharacterized protein JWP87_19 [Labilithrix sp.]|nr:uncharacterized protein [Labilithrix sp.]
MARGFFGREAETSAVLAHLAAGERIVVLRGPPGAGKTTLAQKLAPELAKAGHDVRSVALAHARDRGDVLAAIARATGLPARAADARILIERIAERLEGRRSVLVLDGADHVAVAAGEIAGDLVDATTDVAIVATSRERLGAPLEIVVAVGPLPLSDAVALLRDRTARLAPERVPPDATAEKLALRAGRLPLAIELVAARVATLGAAQVLSGLDGGELAIDALDRALDASWALLSDEDRHALATLSVFRGSFALDAARAVLDTARPAAALDALVEASLVEASDGSEGARFAILDGVRAYAGRRAREAGVAAAAAARHCMYFAQATAPRSDDASTWARLVRDREDLLAAWEHARTNDAGAAARLAVTLDPLLVTQGPAALHRRVLEDTLAALATPAPGTTHTLAPLEIDLRLALGRIDGLRGRHAAALPHFEAALSLAEAIGDRARAGWSAAFLCFSLRPLGRFDEARAHGERAVREALAAREPRLEAMGEQSLGGLELASDDPAAALAHQRRALAAARIAGAPRLEGIALANLALAHRARGDLVEAAAFNAESRDAFERAADRFHLARITVDRGAILLDGGDVDEAELHLLAALDGVIEQGDLEGELEARTGLARCAAARGDDRLAQRRFDELEALARLTDDVVERARIAKLRASSETATRASESARAAPSLRASRDGRTLELGSRRIDLSRRGPLRRILIALVERRLSDAGAALTVADMLVVGWPGEKMRAESGAARVYMAIRRLRVLGLEPVLRTSDEGYALDPDVVVAWLDG